MSEDELPRQTSFPGMGPLWRDPGDVNRHERRRNAENARAKRPRERPEPTDVPQPPEIIGVYIFHPNITIWLSTGSICILKANLEADRTGKMDRGLTQYIARSMSHGYYNGRSFDISPDDVFTTHTSNERSNPRSRAPKKTD